MKKKNKASDVIKEMGEELVQKTKQYKCCACEDDKINEQEAADEMLNHLFGLSDACEIVHTNSTTKGFWNPRSNLGYNNEMYLQNLSSKLMLVVTEISEAVEELRKLDISDCSDMIGIDNEIRHSDFPEELADAFIRLMDIAAYLDIDLDLEISRKHGKNVLRPKMHGKNF